MKLKSTITTLLLLLSQMLHADDRQTLFNDAWRFHRGDITYAMQADFSDEYWRMVDLPHDWRMEPDSLDMIDELADTVGWYRKTFTIRDDDTEKRVFLYFERIHGRAEIWINGHSVYHTSCSCQPIRVDVTPYLYGPWENNTIAIRVSTAPWSKTDYRGAGITHDTWLMKTDRIHLDEWNTQIQTTRVYRKRGRWHADLNLSAMLRNTAMPTDGNIEVVITDPDGEKVFEELYPMHIADSTEFTADITLQNPQSWSYDAPAMYKADIRATTTEGLSDTLRIPFGISTIEYSPYMGLVCNDESPLLQGSTLDYNDRLTGYTAFRRAEALLVEHMQFYGYSAVRCPMGLLSEHFLTSCDTLGVMVLVDTFSPIHPDEEWSGQAIADNIKRFRNHPSIVMWCINDSLREMPVVAAIDKSRPIAVTDILTSSLWSDERDCIGSKTPHAYRLEAERLVSSITMGVSASDTTRKDSVVWLPEVQRWTWQGYEGDTMKVSVYSKSDWVHLHINDKLVSSAKLGKKTHQATFHVPYVPGKISASTLFNDRLRWTPKKPRTKIRYIGFSDIFRLNTVGEPKHIFLSADCKETSPANGELCFVKIEVLDADGNVLPDAEIPLRLHIRGPGLIVAVGNGKGMSSSLHTLRTHQGCAMVVIRPFDAKGTIRLTVYPEGLEAEDIAIRVF